MVSVGTIVWLSSELMFFAGLFAMYFTARSQAGGNWPPEPTELNLALAVPVTLVLIGGLSQALMLPVLGVAALFFRFRRGDLRVKPGRLWDAMLILSVLGLTITGTWTAWTNLEKLKALVTKLFGAGG